MRDPVGKGVGSFDQNPESLPSLAGATDLPAAATGTDGLPATAEIRVAFCVPKLDALPCTPMHFRAVNEQSTQQLPLDEKTPENTGFSGVSGADGEGFEPPLDSRLEQFSRLPP